MKKGFVKASCYFHEYKTFKKKCIKCGKKLKRTFQWLTFEHETLEYLEVKCSQCGYVFGKEVCKDYIWNE